MEMLASKLTPEQKYICRQIRIDALQEFIQARTPVEQYVERRYASHPQEFKDMKLKHVKERVELAEILLRIEFDS